ncbi:hypothetical protein L2E82_15675 [Cichorium intybus]|uniref:Uncharacterized protein n=1 Tax=Cichorium intybus TaxID=13427 RepID=A0ACB9F414_CICIN|nr:hypothetical protein L2E82_15675 [Cichorium intybus]
MKRLGIYGRLSTGIMRRKRRIMVWPRTDFIIQLTSITRFHFQVQLKLPPSLYYLAVQNTSLYVHCCRKNKSKDDNATLESLLPGKQTGTCTTK